MFATLFRWLGRTERSRRTIENQASCRTDSGSAGGTVGAQHHQYAIAGRQRLHGREQHARDRDFQRPYSDPTDDGYALRRSLRAAVKRNRWPNLIPIWASSPVSRSPSMAR